MTAGKVICAVKLQLIRRMTAGYEILRQLIKLTQSPDILQQSEVWLSLCSHNTTIYVQPLLMSVAEGFV